MSLFHKTLNAAIAALQTIRGTTISDRELAKIYGGTSSNLSRWRNGQVQNEGADTLIRMLQDLCPKTIQEILKPLSAPTTHPSPEETQADLPTTFELGGRIFTTQELHQGVAILGGIGTGKTSAVLKPALKNLLALYNQEGGEFAKIGGLILDPRGELLPTIVETFEAVGRPLSDLIVIGGNYPHTYNPIDPTATAEENAEKLARISRVMENHQSRGDNSYWDDVTRNIIKWALQVLASQKINKKVGLDDLCSFLQDEKKAKAICGFAQKLNETKPDPELTDALAGLEHQWFALNPNTKATIKVMVIKIAGPLETDPALQETFCRDTSFKFEDVINQGKLIVFHDQGQLHRSERTISRALYSDFQTWAKRRNGSAAENYKLNTERSLLFFTDEFQEIVGYGRGGDETFAGITQSAKVIQIVTSQSLSSLRAGGTNEHLTTLRNNICTWVILRSTDCATMDLAKFLAGKTGTEAAPESFLTITPEKSKEGPWYSQGLLYHYDEDENKEFSQVVKFPLNFEEYPKEIYTQGKTEKFLSALVSNYVAHLPDQTYELTAEEELVALSLEGIRREIVLEFPEIGETLVKESSRPPKYRMLPPNGSDKLVAQSFNEYRTITWAALSFYPSIYAKIRRSIRDNPVLPGDLHDHLIKINNHELREVFLTILKQSKEDPD